MRTTVAQHSTLLHRRWIAVPAMLGAASLAILLGSALQAAEWNSGIPWPQVPVVDPGPVGGPPADAIVLFDGKDLSQWQGGDKWKVEDGVATGAVTSIRTKQPFGDCQLHVEWAAPEKIEGSGQGRGNSGVLINGQYEVQVLDSFAAKTYPGGQAGAIYGQSPPLANGIEIDLSKPRRRIME